MRLLARALHEFAHAGIALEIARDVVLRLAATNAELARKAECTHAIHQAEVNGLGRPALRAVHRIEGNAATLVHRLGALGIGVTGITKATLGSPAVAGALRRGGVRSLGDARVENIERLRASGIDTPVVLVRTPMLSQVDRVVQLAEASCNTELVVLEALSAAAHRRRSTHDVILMVEGTSFMGLGGPNLVKGATGQTVDADHRAGAVQLAAVVPRVRRR